MSTALRISPSMMYNDGGEPIDGASLQERSRRRRSSGFLRLRYGDYDRIMEFGSCR